MGSDRCAVPGPCWEFVGRAGTTTGAPRTKRLKATSSVAARAASWSASRPEILGMPRRPVARDAASKRGSDAIAQRLPAERRVVGHVRESTATVNTTQSLARQPLLFGRPNVEGTRRAMRDGDDSRAQAVERLQGARERAPSAPSATSPRAARRRSCALTPSSWRPRTSSPPARPGSSGSTVAISSRSKKANRTRTDRAQRDQRREQKLRQVRRSIREFAAQAAHRRGQRL
jgi:hypothetical protein